MCPCEKHLQIQIRQVAVCCWENWFSDQRITQRRERRRKSTTWAFCTARRASYGLFNIKKTWNHCLSSSAEKKSSHASPIFLLVLPCHVLAFVQVTPSAAQFLCSAVACSLLLYRWACDTWSHSSSRPHTPSASASTPAVTQHPSC